MAENGPISSTPTKHTSICPRCKGNGYVRIDTVDGPDQVKQCWVCGSEGELKSMYKKTLIILFTSFILTTGCSKVEWGDFEWDPAKAAARITFGQVK